jgi:hypothetical protein
MLKRAAFCGLGFLSIAALAQTPAAEWSSVAKITNGTCGEGSVAHITERPGNMRLRLVYRNGQQYAEFDVALAADGSGKAEFTGAAGAATKLDVSSGAGKRPMKTSQVIGICQWLWTPT